MKKRIGIVVLATNSYFILGLRFIRRFMHFYQGESEIVFYFFSDEDPQPYLPEDINVNYYYQKHGDWKSGTNSKFKNIVNIQYDLRKEVDYVFYFDADTNVDKPFTEEWFLEDYVAGEHFGNRSWLANGKGFSRDPRGHDYVSPDSNLPYTYRYGAFFGGTVENMVHMCEILRDYQVIDYYTGYEPKSDDEGYLNAYFHHNHPTYTVPCEKFEFLISDKGGYEEQVRHPQTDISNEKRELLKNKDKLFNIANKVIIYE